MLRASGPPEGLAELVGKVAVLAHGLPKGDGHGGGALESPGDVGAEAGRRIDRANALGHRREDAGRGRPQVRPAPGDARGLRHREEEGEGHPPDRRIHGVGPPIGQRKHRGTNGHAGHARVHLVAEVPDADAGARAKDLPRDERAIGAKRREHLLQGQGHPRPRQTDAGIVGEVRRFLVGSRITIAGE